MNKILLSLVVMGALSHATQEKQDTTVTGEAQLYYYTTDKDKLFSKDSTNAGGAVTLNISHKLTKSITVNLTAIGYDSLGSSVGGALEGTRHSTDAYFGNANMALTMDKTTLIIGRQELDTPMLGSFDWLLAPSHFEAGTFVQKLDGVTMIASYIKKLRANNSGTEFIKMVDDNYAIGMVYSGVVDANIWYYNIDAGNYTQIYADSSESKDGVLYTVQTISTNYDSGDDSMAYGVKIGTVTDGWNFSIAYNSVKDREVGFVEIDSLYTSSWNSWASTKLNNSFKIETSNQSGNLATTISYAKYDEGDETDLIFDYQVAKDISMGTVFTNTKYMDNSSTDKALELMCSYKY